MNRMLILSMLGLLSLVLIACGAGGDSDDSPALSDGGDEFSSEPGNGGGAPPVARTDSEEGANSASDGDAAGSGTGEFAYQEDGRKVVVTSELTLEAEDVTARFLEVGRAARLSGGFVSDSQLLTREVDDETVTYATISVRVPAGEHDDFLVAMRGMEGVSVTGEQSTAREVTEEYTDLTSRMSNLERTEARYLDLLAEAETVEDILLVNDRIDGVRMEIDRIQGRLNVLNDLVDLATVTITLEPVLDGVSVAETSSGNRFTQAWKDAWQAMGDFAGDASVAGAWGLVLAICAAPFVIVALAVRGVAKRRTHTANGDGTAAGPA